MYKKLSLEECQDLSSFLISFFFFKKKKKKNQFIVTNTDVSDPNCWEPSLLWPAAVCSRLILLKNNYKSSIPFFSTKITGGGGGNQPRETIGIWLCVTITQETEVLITQWLPNDMVCSKHIVQETIIDISLWYFIFIEITHTYKLRDRKTICSTKILLTWVWDDSST